MTGIYISRQANGDSKTSKSGLKIEISFTIDDMIDNCYEKPETRNTMFHFIRITLSYIVFVASSYDIHQEEAWVDMCKYKPGKQTLVVVLQSFCHGVKSSVLSLGETNYWIIIRQL